MKLPGGREPLPLAPLAVLTLVWAGANRGSLFSALGTLAGAIRAICSAVMAVTGAEAKSLSLRMRDPVTTIDSVAAAACSSVRRMRAITSAPDAL